MPCCRNATIVTEFLRDALAADALGVPELETRARAAGLLGERQHITDAKAFKRAKKSLGIQRVFYRRNVDAAKIRLPWTRSGGSQ
jgi:hypothetical protein